MKGPRHLQFPSRRVGKTKTQGETLRGFFTRKDKGQIMTGMMTVVMKMTVVLMVTPGPTS